MSTPSSVVAFAAASDANGTHGVLQKLFLLVEQATQTLSQFSTPLQLGLAACVLLMIALLFVRRRQKRLFSLSRGDFEAGLRRLSNHVSTDPTLSPEVLRLLDELGRRRRSTRSANSLRLLDEISRRTTGANFEGFCRTDTADLLPVGRMLRSAVPNLGCPTVGSESDWMAARLREASQGLRWIDANCGFNPETYVGLPLRVKRARARYRVSGMAYRHIEDIFKTIRGFIVLLGDPGGGKSISLRHLGTALADRAIRAGIDEHTSLPMYVHLGDYTACANAGGPQPLDDYLIQYSAALWKQSYEDTKARFEILASAGKIVFLLDSLDEMPRDDYSDRYDQIRLFMRRFALCRYVFACRPVDYDHRLGVTEVVVEPMPDKQIEGYLKRYLRQASSFSRSRASMIVNRLRDPRGQFPTYLSNPFYLSLAGSYLASAGQTPVSLASMYESIIEAVWKETHHGSAQANSTASEAFLRILSWLGYQATRHEGTGTEIEVARLLNLAASDTSVSAAAVENAIALGSKLKLLRLRELGKRTVTFQHHRFQEYFAARFLVGKEQKLDEYLPRSGVLGGIWWQETIALLCSLSETPSTVLDYLLSLKISEQVMRSLDHQQRLTVEFIDAERLELLARCYEAATGRVGETAGLRILSEIAGRLPMADPAERVRCVRALARIKHFRADSLLRDRLDDPSAWVREESFSVILHKHRLENPSRRFLIRYLWEALASGRGLTRGVTIAKTLVKQRVLPDMFAAALLTSLVAVLLSLAFPLAWLVSTLILIRHGGRVLVVLLCMAPFLYQVYQNLKLFRSLNLQRQIPQIIQMGACSLALHFALGLPGLWFLLLLPFAMVAALLSGFVLRALLTKVSIVKILQENVQVHSVHQELHDTMRVLMTRAESEGGIIREGLMAELASLYIRGCMHVHESFISLVRSFRVDYPAYIALKRHAGVLDGKDPHYNEVWQLVIEKSFQLRRDATVAGDQPDAGLLVGSVIPDVRLASFEEVMKMQRSPLGVIDLIGLANSFEHLNRKEESLKALKAALNLAPSDSTIREKIARIEAEGHVSPRPARALPSNNRALD